jgi:hypothetical protein
LKKIFSGSRPDYAAAESSPNCFFGMIVTSSLLLPSRR